MEQAIRAELWKVLDTSDLDSVTSKEVGRVRGREEAGLGGGEEPSGWEPAFLPLESSRPAFPLSPASPGAWPQLSRTDGRC